MHGSLKSAMKQATLYLIFIINVSKNDCILASSPAPIPFSRSSNPPPPNPNLAEKHAGWENASFPVKFVRCKSNLTDFYL